MYYKTRYYLNKKKHFQCRTCNLTESWDIRKISTLTKLAVFCPKEILKQYIFKSLFRFSMYPFLIQYSFNMTDLNWCKHLLLPKALTHCFFLWCSKAIEYNIKNKNLLLTHINNGLLFSASHADVLIIGYTFCRVESI